MPHIELFDHPGANRLYFPTKALAWTVSGSFGWRTNGKGLQSGLTSQLRANHVLDKKANAPLQQTIFSHQMIENLYQCLATLVPSFLH